VAVAAMIFISSISGALDDMRNAATLLITLPLSLVSIWLTVNMIKGVFKIYDKHSVSPESVFKWHTDSTRDLIKYIGLNILLGLAFLVFVAPIVLLLISALSGVYGLSNYDIVAGVLIILVGIYVNTRLMFSLYIMLDNNVGVIDSIKASWKMSRGHVLKLLGFYLASIVIMILGLVLLIIPGLLFGGVLIFATTHIYRKLK
jgi:membrane-anchored glycerophosphoryl diester phosphodiesterase (GDPDase)